MKALNEKIPLDRVGVLVGSKGETKKELEHGTHTTLEIDGKTGEVTISTKKEDAYNLYRAQLVVQAIGVGFSPVKAFKLLEDDQYLTVINLRDYLEKGKDLERQVSRIIGTHGKTREEIERNCQASMSVYEEKIGIIASGEGTDLAEKAIEMLLQGKPQNNVYAYMEKARKEELEKTVKI